MRIRLTVNGTAHDLCVPALRRLLDILREDLGLTGTKEGCGEGECGACAVHLDGLLVNACLVPALQLHGRAVRTIEGLGRPGAPDALQQAFMEEGAAQCGFCIPGMIMAARALLDQTPHPTRHQTREALAGNLCRCTGYERILRAVERAAELTARSASSSLPPEPEAAPAAGLRSGGESAAGRDDDPQVYLPGSVAEALEVLGAADRPVAILAGTTDLLVEHKLGWRPPARLLDISRLPELARIESYPGGLRIGAAATFAEIRRHAHLRSHYPALAEMAASIGAAAIQNRATIGGNLMTASPAADAPPVLIALGAVARLVSRAGERRVPLDAFYTGYRQSVRRADELLAAIEIPDHDRAPSADGLAGRGCALPPPGPRRHRHQGFFKVATRRAQAISKVSLGGLLVLDERFRIETLRLAAGSVAPTPLSLAPVGEALRGQPLTAERLPILRTQVDEILAACVRPIDDVRSTAAYRLALLGRLIGRFLEDAHDQAQRES